MQLLWDDGKWRSPTVDNDRRQVVRHIGDPVPVEAQDLRRVLHWPEDRPGQHDRAEGVETKLELGNDPEIPSCPAHTPEEIGVRSEEHTSELQSPVHLV